MKFVFLLLSFLSFSQETQERIATGFVYDHATKTPVPYVNISILKSSVGTSSDDDGSYKLSIKNEDLNKSVKLSSLGYKDSILKIADFVKLKDIYLKPIIEKLPEVRLTKQQEEIILVVNKIKEEDLCQGYGSHAKNPWILGVYFPFKEAYENTEYLKSVRFHFGNFKNNKAKFRLRIFSIGKDSLPDKDLLRENVIVSLKKKQKNMDVDISDHGIIFPREGFYVAFEWLYIPYNAEKVTFQYKNRKNEKRLKYNPTFSGTCEEEGIYKVAMYNSGKWRFYASNKYQSDEKVIPAISLTLSN